MSTVRNQKEKHAVRYTSTERINLYATDLEGRKAIAWARKRWRAWKCADHEPPRSASTLLRDLLIHAMHADRKRK